MKLTKFVLALALSVCGCNSEMTLVDGPVATYEPELLRSVLSYLSETGNQPEQGDWPQDFGDANYYGPGFLFRYGNAGGNAAQIALAKENTTYNSNLIERATTSFDVFYSRLEDVMMSGMGLIEAQAFKSDDMVSKRLEDLLNVLNLLSKTFEYYPSEEDLKSSYAAATYGPTTLNGTLALMNLEYAYTADGDDKEERVATGLEILKYGDEKAFDEKLGYYRFSLTEEKLHLYPNVVQMLAHTRAYQLTEQKKYLDRAQTLYAAIQPLKVKGEGRYRSPYSAKYMGAKTDDYTTLSSQNYTMMAFAVLYQVTGDKKLKEEVAQVLEFVRSHLFEGRRVLHHWMDGKIAQPSNPEFYCSGCNLQLLYVIWRLEDLLKE
ncbi:MAG: hypothetical protein V1754_00565 [Pseudomonadota bacterium]